MENRNLRLYIYKTYTLCHLLSLSVDSILQHAFKSPPAELLRMRVSCRPGRSAIFVGNPIVHSGANGAGKSVHTAQ